MCLGIATFAGAIPASSDAALADNSTQSGRPGSLLNISVVPLGRDVTVVGEANPAARVQFTIAVRPRNTDALAARIASGGRVSPAELAARFLPTPADYDAVVSFVRGTGLTIDRTYPTRLMLAVSGTVAEVSRAFGVHFAHITVAGEDFGSADTAPFIPESIAPLVTGINGLQPHLRQHTDHIRRAHTASFGGYTPLGLQYAYASNKLKQTGAGITTAIIIDTVPNTSDLTTFWSDFTVAQSSTTSPSSMS